MNKRQKARAKTKMLAVRYTALIIAGIINATGVVLFLSASGILDGGLSGTSMLFDKITPLPLAFFLVALNLPFFLLGAKRLGYSFILNSIVAIATYSLVSLLYQTVFHFGKEETALVHDMFLSAIFGGLLSGIGSGLTIRFGGAMDGMEATAVMFAKKVGLTVGQFVMAYNVVLYVIACFVFGDFTIGLYSIVTYYVGLKAVDGVVDGLDKAKGCFIVTGKGDKVAGALSKEFGRGVTLISSSGYHSKAKSVTIYCVVNRFEVGRLKSIVADTDPRAFVSINDISETVGTKIKYSSKKSNAKKSVIQNAPVVTAPIENQEIITPVEVLENLEKEVEKERTELFEEKV